MSEEIQNENPEVASQDVVTDPTPAIGEGEKKKAAKPTDTQKIVNKQKKADKKLTVKIKSEKAKATKIIKESIFAKQFAVGTFPGNSVSAHTALVKEAAVQLLVDGVWTIESKVLDNGVTIQYIK
jgi:hypothetical protein